jgi:abnormal spindle-like microcephaly-associated protein
VVDVIVGDDLRTALGHDARDDTHKNTSEQKTRQMLIDALMRDAEIESTYGSAGSGGPPFREGYAEELSGTVLKRTLLLAFLLDRVQAGVSANAPLLFRKSSSVKTSADFVRLALSASCHGEGDLLRRLGHFGYKLHYAQDPVREFDFAVINLAVDLRDGIRLCHLVDVLGGVCGETSALTDASFPATARVAKKRNVERALSLAVSLGVVGLRSVCPDEIVDGSLEKTSLVLYHLQMHFQAPLLLGEWVTVTTETEVWRERRVAQITRGDVCKTFWKNTMASGAGTGATREDVDEELVAEALFNEELADARLSSSYEEAGDDSETVSVVQQCETKLLRWSRAVVSTFGAEVTNLSSDFASGAVLCLLIHAYAPELVHLREITRVDATSLGCLSIDAHAAGCVKRNFDVAKRACLVMPRGDELAKVPFDEIDATTCADGVSKHVVVSFLVVLRHRLLGLKQQHAAARVVQQTWLKRRRVRFEVEEHEPSVWAFRVQVAATRVLQKFCRGFLGRRVARERAAGIVTCQTLRRGFVARRLLRTAIDAATTIAKHARGMSARFEWIDIRFATLVAQTHCRGAFFRRKFLWLKDVTTKLQQLRRASVTRNAFLEYRTQSRAATKIASNFKTWCCRWDFLSLRDAAVVCQRRVRASRKTKTQRSAFLSLRRAAVSAQTVRRGAVCRRWFCEQKDAALTITRHWRGFTQRENFLDLKCYTLTCQASRRGAVQRRAFTTLRDAAVVSQRAARRAMAKRRADAEKNKCQEASNNLRHTAAITVQRHVRGWRAREEYLDFLCDVISCQALWRGALARKRFSCLVDEAVKRAAEVSARNLLELTARESAAHELAAARLADHTERQTAIEKAKSLKAETKRRVDAKTPGKSVRTRNSEIAPERNPSKAVAVKAERKLTFDLLQTTAEMETQAATVVQTAWRGWTCRVDFALVRWATVTAQAAVRGANARRAFVTLRHAAVACQRIARDTAQARKATFRAEAATLRRRRAAMGASAAAPARLLAAAPARVAAAPARVAAAPARLARNAFQATARRARTSSNSALAWSTASSVGASSEDEAEEAYAGFEDAATLSDQDDGNSSQDLSRFDQGHFESDEYEPRENKGFAAATAAAAALADARSLGDVRHALGALALAVQASAGGRAGASSQHALRSLLRTMRRCDRGEKHAPVLALAYEVLRTLSFDETGPGASCLFAQKDTLVTLTEHMQIFRDRPEVVGAAAVVLGNLCRDTQRARAVARAERGRTARRIKGIAEILTNTLAARKSRGAGYGQSLGEDRKAREEHTYVVALTHTVHAMTDLVTQLARCEGEVVYERVTARVSFSRPNEEGVEPFVAPSVPIAAAAPATKFKSAPPRSSSRLGNAQLAASKVVQVREVKEKPGHGRAPHNKQTNCPYTDERRAPLAPRYAPTAFAKKPVTNADAGRPGKGAPPPSVRREKENDTDTEQRTPPPPFSFASHFTTRWDTHNASPIMSPRYVR